MAAKSGKNPKSVPAVQSVNKSVAEMDSRKRSLPVIDDFDFYAQLAKLMILRKDDTEGADDKLPLHFNRVVERCSSRTFIDLMGLVEIYRLNKK